MNKVLANRYRMERCAVCVWAVIVRFLDCVSALWVQARASWHEISFEPVSDPRSSPSHVVAVAWWPWLYVHNLTTKLGLLNK